MPQVDQQPKPQTPEEWNALLAAEGMSEDVTPPQEVPAGDALDIKDPVAAAEKAAQVRTEQSGDETWENASNQSLPSDD